MDARQMVENFQGLLLQTEKRRRQDAEEAEKRRRQEAEEAEKRPVSYTHLPRQKKKNSFV